MTVSKHQILVSLASIEREAPLYLGDMPVADDLVRDIFATSMAAYNASSDFQSAPQHSREVSLLATLTHVMLEAAYLRFQLHATALAAASETGRLLAKASTH